MKTDYDVIDCYDNTWMKPYKEEIMEKLMPRIDFTEYCKDKYILDLGDYEIKVEDGKTYAVRKKSQHPKTYEDCCKILGLDSDSIKVQLHCMEHGEGELYRKFIKLRRCRNAYWKIAGDWKPDYKNPNKETFYFLFNSGEYIECGQAQYPTNKVLIFPTEEMRDVFLENFRDEIEQCKELL